MKQKRFHPGNRLFLGLAPLILALLALGLLVETASAVDGGVDLRIRKDDGGVSAAAGDTIQYTLIFTNVGAADATGVVLTDTVPVNTTFDETASTSGWSCVDGAPAGSVCVLDIGAVFDPIPPRTSGQLSFAVQVDRPLATGVSAIFNAAAIGDDGAGGADANPGDNFDAEITPVVAAPDLQVTKTDEGVTPAGGLIRYTIVYTNTGDRDSDSTIISETVPANTTFAPFPDSSNGWICNPASGVAGTNCTIDVGTVPSTGRGGSVVFAVTVDDPLPAGVTETTNNVEIYGVSVEPDRNPADNSFSLTTELNAPPVVEVAPASQAVQYSDAVVTVAVTATDSGSDPLTLTTSTLPDALSLSAASCGPETGGGVVCTWMLTGQMLEPAGPYNVEVTASDGVLTSEPATITFEVIPEDARVAFDAGNEVSQQVDGNDDDLDTATLVVQVTERQPDTTVELGQVAQPGNIAEAVVSTELVPVGPGGPISGICTPEGSGVGLPHSYADVLEVSCVFTDVPVNMYLVQVTVSGDYYTGGGEDVFAAYDPDAGFATGGGWFYWPDTDDTDTGYPGDRTNFGYTMKYNKKATNVKGSLLVIRHMPDGSIYRLKSNALDSLSIGAGDSGAFGWASFTGKATYLEPGWSEPVGNHTFLVYVEDHGQPGAGADRFWIEVQDRSGDPTGLSMDRQATDNAISLEGGNIVVPHGGNKGKGPK